MYSWIYQLCCTYDLITWVSKKYWEMLPSESSQSEK